MKPPLFSYRGEVFPEYLKEGNACRFITPTALEFCKGKGLDIGANKWPLPVKGIEAIDVGSRWSAMELPHGSFDFIFSSHCLEHLPNPVAALEHWMTRLKPGAPLFLYLPHRDMIYWRPQHCRKHLHSWSPAEMAEILTDLGLVDVIHGERDLAWSFAAVGFKAKA